MVAVMTMVHDDFFFLEKWVSHYRGQPGIDAMYIVSHGDLPEHRDIAPEANIIPYPRDDLHNFDMRRQRFLSKVKDDILKVHSAVLFADVDEIIVLDGTGARSYEDLVDQMVGDFLFFPYFLVPQTDDEDDLDLEKDWASQRKYLLRENLGVRASLFRADAWTLQDTGWVPLEKVRDHPVSVAKGAYNIHLKRISRSIEEITLRKRMEMTNPDVTENAYSDASPIWKSARNRAGRVRRGTRKFLAENRILNDFYTEVDKIENELQGGLHRKWRTGVIKTSFSPSDYLIEMPRQLHGTF